MNKYRNIVFVLIFMGMVSLLVGATYSFFNYTRNGSNNTISVGRINFITRQTETINLTNVFPIDKSTIGTDTTNVDEVVIEIEGDTDYNGGIEYLVSSVDSEIYSSTGKLIPISLDVTVDDLGTENTSYFTSRDNSNSSIYKKLVGDTLVGDQMLLVGYIVPNATLGTPTGIDGSITIKAFFDKDVIGISDTYDGTESDLNGTSEDWADGRTILTTTEWNAIQTNGVSFKIKVEANQGIWVVGSLEEIMRKSAVMDNIASTYVSRSSGINFGEVSSDTNGKGIYTRAGTENDPYPIMYYRGDIDNNNVLFGGYCWKAVRTTEDGGVKLLYNGEYENIYERVPLEESDFTIVENTNNAFVYDSANKWFTLSSTSGDYYFDFKLPDGNYIVELTGQFASDDDSAVITSYDDETDFAVGTWSDGGIINLLSYVSTTSSNIFYINFERTDSSYHGSMPSILNVRVLSLGNLIDFGCENNKINVGINLANEDFFSYASSNHFESISSVGYMTGDIHKYNKAYATSGAYFGNSFTYNNGVYTLTDTRVGYNSSHHYTCNLTTADGTCSTLRYYFYGNYYLTLTNGDNINDAFEKAFQNNNDSNAKQVIDTWYQSNFTSYTNMLEDSIWCNDRMLSNRAAFDPNNGVISNVNTNINTIFFDGFYRNTLGIIQFNCTNKRDSFTVNNIKGNSKLTYPIALLTSDELVTAGYAATNETYHDYNTTSYLYKGNYYYTMSSETITFSSYAYYVSVVDSELMRGISTKADYGKILPAITLKHGINVIKGDGTEFNPYVIE